ncbi:UvrD-helicase domain-containing protein [Nocardioides cheoyonin]|uniref:UvrD-helicase domain-containing protein n=1 Tax=Nocardioides cheoyonin TaxID=3156615 RepID=UPI0032B4D976
MQPFDVCGPLPGSEDHGTTTLLEASAGTGKTFTIGALVTRYVAEGVAELDELLVITFGRAASQELRDRVRAHLVEAERAFAAAESGADPGVGSDVLRQLLDVEPSEVVVRRRRLSDALAAFDAATIATTHQFCQLVLRSLGVAGDTDAGAELVESLDELVVEVVDDLYLCRFGQDQDPPPFGRDDALALAREAVDDPQAVLAPADPRDQVAVARVTFAADVRAEIERRKRRLGLLSYDDLLSRLADALEDPAAPARARMRQRWRIVLVDEFQDTDPVQWQVLDRAFSGHATMVLIGDPKQAIYAFRSGDVFTYLTAARAADTRATLGTNWRSDGDLVRRLLVPLRGAALGDADIVVRDVAAHHTGTRLAGAPHPSPFRVRRVPRTGFRLTKSKLIKVGDARSFIARDCAADIAGLLASGATWCGRPVVAGDVAVIVAARDHGLLVQQELHARGVPAVMAGGGDVFLTPAGDQWLTLLEALESPHRSGLVRAAALTCFLGCTPEQLDAEGEALTARVSDVLRGWALLLRGRGALRDGSSLASSGTVAALVEAAEERGLNSRVLGLADGERLLTDLRHLGQLLHEVSVRESLGLTALLEWFREERRRTAALERPRRLDSDAAAVQIVTVHGSKGLQYPVVYLPFGYDNYVRTPSTALFHDASTGLRTLDVSGGGAQWPDHTTRHRSEELGEELRKLYVALTRAQSQVVAWWAPTSNTSTGGLHRLLFGRGPDVAEVPDEVDAVDDDLAARVFASIEELGGPTAEVAQIGAAVPDLPAPAPGELAVRTFDRRVDTEWRRTSYSGLIRVEDAHPGVASEPEETRKDDEPDATPEPEPESSPPPEGDVVVSPMADLPAGATFGSLVHAVLEHADPEAPDLREELLDKVREQLRWWPIAAEPEALAHGLLPLNRTPLGPLADGLPLAAIPLRDRLRELDFEFPLAGGDASGRGERPEIRLRDLGPLLRQHLPPGDPLAAYADRLEQPVLGDQVLRGYLSGSVDAVLRLPTGRFLVVDYKTNHLGPDALDYTQDKLAEAMLHSHYPLQALLYSVVVHRFLRWRLPGYDPEVHLGGVLYLYVRGMCGPETPLVDGHPTGVFSWQPPASLTLALSDLLDGASAGSTTEGAA